MVSCKLAGDIGIERSGSLSTESDQRGDGDAGFAALFKLHFKFIIIFTPVDEISRVAFTPFTFFCIEFAGGGGGGAAAAAATAIAADFSPLVCCCEFETEVSGVRRPFLPDIFHYCHIQPFAFVSGDPTASDGQSSHHRRMSALE